MKFNNEKLKNTSFVIDKEKKIEGRIASDIKPWLKFYDVDVEKYTDEKTAYLNTDMNVYDYFLAVTKQYGNALMIPYCSKNYHREDVITEVEKYIKRFNKMGINKGDIVSFMMLNNPDIIFMWLALSKIGAITNLIKFDEAEERIRDILNKTNEILAYDMNFGEIYNRINGYLKKFNLEKSINIVNEENSDKTKENMKDDKENSGEEKSNNENAEQNNNVVEGGIGGGNEVEVKDEAEEKQTSQMEIDAKYIKDNYNLDIPLQGTVTSRFGIRTPNNIVSANHAGIDIGANEGTKIVAAMDGEATLVSQEGDYGNHIKITNGNVTTLYAHCKSLYINQGDKISKGMK